MGTGLEETRKMLGGSAFSFITREATGTTRFQFAGSMLTPEDLQQ